MGCFSTPRSEQRRSPSLPRHSAHRSSAVSAKDSFSLLSNKPVELPDPRTLENGHKPVGGIARRPVSSEVGAVSDHSKAGVLNRAGGRTAFSGPLVGYNVEVESRAGTANYFSCDDGKRSCTGLRSLRRATSFGGRPQPLPLPVDEETPPRKQLYLPLPAPEVATTGIVSGASYTRSFKLEDGPAGSWTSRRGRVAPVGGLPLPPPSVASKLVPNLAAFEFYDLVLATDDFAANSCFDKGAFGTVFVARLKDATDNHDSEIDTAVLRLPENASQGSMEWKAEVQLLAQLSNSNICAVKGYCTHEAGPRLSTSERRQERLLVFEQPSNGALADHLFGSRRMSYLDWATRIDIALGAARGLSYIHDRAPLEIVYKEFKASNVLLDGDYVPKLAGYGLSVTVSPANRTCSFTTSMMLSQAHAKSNVWSFGILLLEILTGKNSRDAIFFGDEKNFLQWGQKFFKEESKLSHIIDPRMRGVCSVSGAMEVVTLLQQCVSKKEALRPSMSEIVATLKVIKANQCSNPGALRGNHKGPASWVMSPRRPETQARHSRSYLDTQTSSDASSSSENEDTFLSRMPPRALGVVV